MSAQSVIVPPRSRGLGKALEKLPLWLLLGAGAVIMIGPFYWMVVTAFKPQQEILVFPPTWWPQQPTFAPWEKLTQLRGGFQNFFRNSLFVTTAITALTLLTSSIAG